MMINEIKEYARLDILKGAFYATIACRKYSKTINYFARLRCFVSFERIIERWLEYKLLKIFTIIQTYYFTTLFAS